MKELIEYCQKRIKETGLTSGYYHELIKLLTGEN